MVAEATLFTNCSGASHQVESALSIKPAQIAISVINILSASEQFREYDLDQFVLQFVRKSQDTVRQLEKCRTLGKCADCRSKTEFPRNELRFYISIHCLRLTTHHRATQKPKDSYKTIFYTNENGDLSAIAIIICCTSSKGNHYPWMEYPYPSI